MWVLSKAARPLLPNETPATEEEVICALLYINGPYWSLCLKSSWGWQSWGQPLPNPECPVLPSSQHSAGSVCWRSWGRAGMTTILVHKAHAGLGPGTLGSGEVGQGEPCVTGEPPQSSGVQSLAQPQGPSLLSGAWPGGFYKVSVGETLGGSTALNPAPPPTQARLICVAWGHGPRGSSLPSSMCHWRHLGLV